MGGVGRTADGPALGNNGYDSISRWRGQGHALIAVIFKLVLVVYDVFLAPDTLATIRVPPERRSSIESVPPRSRAR